MTNSAVPGLEGLIEIGGAASNWRMVPSNSPANGAARPLESTPEIRLPSVPESVNSVIAADAWKFVGHAVVVAHDGVESSEPLVMTVPPVPVSNSRSPG
jgi:hypothetical protein